jgi:hypothetical protein
VNQFVFANAVARHDQYAEIAVLNRRPGGDVRNRSGAQMVGMEAVVRHEDHPHIVASAPQQRSQHLVVELICGRNHAAVEFEIALAEIHGWRGGWYFMKPWQKWSMAS